MTREQSQALTKGQKVYSAYLYGSDAYLHEFTYLGRTKGGAARLRTTDGRILHEHHLTGDGYHLTRRDAAQGLVGEANEALDSARRAAARAQALLMDAEARESTPAA